MNKNGKPIISKQMTISEDPATEITNIASLVLSPSDTAGLFGKYVYQITFIDADGNTEIPNQGILMITKNINEEILFI